MAKRKRSLNLSKTELVFEDDKVVSEKLWWQNQCFFNCSEEMICEKKDNEMKCTKNI